MHMKGMTGKLSCNRNSVASVSEALWRAQCAQVEYQPDSSKVQLQIQPRRHIEQQQVQHSLIVVKCNCRYKPQVTFGDGRPNIEWNHKQEGTCKSFDDCGVFW